MNPILDKIKLLHGDSLKAKSARGVLTLGIGTGIERTLRIVRYMILTRLLIPDEFGLMAIILVLVNIFETVTEVGVKQSVIQNKRGADPEYLNATWWFQSLRGLGLFTIAILAAPLISSFYEKPRLLSLLQASFLAIVFRGFISPRAHVLQREYKFGRMVLLFQGSALIGTFVTIGYAFIAKNVWALVIGYVTEYGTLCLMSYVLAPFRPWFGINRQYLKELTSFARKMFGLPILTLIGFGAPIFVLGKVVTEEQVGMYSLAAQFAILPIDLFTKIISPVLLPGFAQKQDDRNSLCRAVLKISRLAAAAIIPLMAFIATCSGGLLLLAWGPTYVDVTITCSILSLIILARTEGAVLSATYIAVGQPQLQRRCVVLRAVLVAALIYPAVVHFGLLGAAVVAVLGNYIPMLMQIFWCRRVIPLKFDSYFRNYIPGLLLAFPVVLTIRLLLLLSVDSMIPILASGGLALLMTYAAYFGITLYINNRRALLYMSEKLKVTQNQIAAPEVMDA
jgi:O-antigen/teichoic acid export membrane protein